MADTGSELVQDCRLHKLMISAHWQHFSGMDWQECMPTFFPLMEKYDRDGTNAVNLTREQRVIDSFIWQHAL